MTGEEQKRIFSKNLNHFISTSGKQQKEIAKDLNISPTTFNTWCVGKVIPPMAKLQRIAEYFNITKYDLLENSDYEPQLNKRDQNDISKRLEAMLSELESRQTALMFSGEPLDEETRELLTASLENSLRIAKINAKQKFTPNKYRK
jgi:transcriptional regulator with XRE-family HTH domain